MNRISRSNDFLWMGITLFFLESLALLIPLPPNDYWWYVRLGKDILSTGAVPTTDTLSFTMLGQPIVYQSWLSAVLFWLAYLAGGMALTFLVRAVVVGVTYGMLWKIMREMGVGPKTATILTLILGLSSSSNWVIRPQLFTYPLFVLTLWILLRWREGNNKFLWVIPIVSIFWTNLHGSFVLLFFLIGCAWLFGKGDRKALFIVLIISAIATLINPRGYVLIKAVADTFLAPGARNLSTEWHAPSNQGWQMNLFFGWLLLFIPAAAYSSRKLSMLDWAWFFLFGWMALSGLRYVIWFQFILAVLTAYLVAEWSVRYIDTRIGTKVPSVNYALGVLFMFIPLVFVPGVRDSWWPKSPEVLEKTPVAAVEWLAQHEELPGPMWSDISYSSYLPFALPSRPVWIDTRFQVLYPPELFDRYIRIADAAPDWQAQLAQDNINLVLVSQKEEPYLFEALQRSALWCEKYSDKESAIFARLQAGASCP